VRDGAVLPILHLNGYKIANPTVLARIPQNELEDLFRGYGYNPHFLEGDDPNVMHPAMAGLLDKMLDEIAAIQRAARQDGNKERPRWPMLILKTPPIYPAIAKTARVSGTVELEATISKNGTIKDVRVASGPVMLRQAAVDAVRTWRYKPYQLNNQPTEVETTVNVVFNLGN